MIFRSLKIDRFGKLADKEFAFSDKINIIYGENEAGKTTIHSLLIAMLYGMNSKVRNVRSNLRSRFIPWAGNGFGASLSMQNDEGHEIIISRSFGKTKSKDTLLCYNNVSGKELELGDEPGKVLFDLQETAFQNSLFISQLGAAVSSNDDILQKLSNLKNSGEESVSYLKVKSNLEEAKKQLERKNSGKLWQKKEELYTLQECKAKAEEAQQTLDGFRKEKIALFEEREMINELLAKGNKQISLIKKNDAIKKYRQLREAKERVEQLKRDIAAFGLDEKINDDYFRKAYALLQEINYKQEEYHELVQEHGGDLHAVIEEKNEILKKLEDMSCYHAIAQEDKQVFQAAEQEYTIKKKELADFQAKEKNANKQRVWGYCAGILGIFSVFLYPLLHSIALFICIFFIICSVLFLLLNYRKNKKIFTEISNSIMQAEKRLIEYQNRFCADSFSQLLQKEHEYNILKNQSRLISQQLAKIEQISTDIDAKKLQLRELYHMYAQAENSIDKQDFEKLELRWKKKSCLKTELFQQEAVYKTLLNGQAFEEIENLENIDISLEITTESLDSLEEKQKQLQNRLLEVSKELSKIDTILIHQTPQNLAKIEDSILNCRRRIKEYQEYSEALSISLDVLDHSFEEIQSIFGRKLNEKVGEILNYLSKGKYRKVFIDETFQIKLLDNETNSVYPLDYFSNGTLDLVYFSFRLSIAEILFPDKKIPLLLDDTFVELDEKRLHCCLDYLLQATDRFQVILFTCQNREMDYFQNNPQVNLIKL